MVGRFQVKVRLRKTCESNYLAENTRYQGDPSVVGVGFSAAAASTIRSRAKVSKIVPVWLNFVVNLAP